jgi:tyrosyl-tRNA synthetase
MKTIYGYIILLAMLLQSFSAQNFYNTITKVDYDDNSKILKFTTKLNTANIEAVLKTSANAPGFDGHVKKYMADNFYFYADDAPVKLNFTGSQTNGETVWVYYEALVPNKLTKLKFKNNIFIDFNNKQVNLLSLSYKGSNKTLTFMKGKEIIEAFF